MIEFGANLRAGVKRASNLASKVLHPQWPLGARKCKVDEDIEDADERAFGACT